jgi:DNA-binding response OmpR family regulator
MLPGKEGFELLEELKKSEQTKNVPVIVFSNRDGVNDRKIAEELGATGFYVKAMTDLSELVEKIEALS